jgi:hypothetical protein
MRNVLALLIAERDRLQKAIDILSPPPPMHHRRTRGKRPGGQRRFWSQDEIRMLKELFPSHSSAEVAKALGRSIFGVRGIAHKIGLEKTPEYITGRGRRQRVERVVTFAAIEGGHPTLMRRTVDVLCPEELERLEDALPFLMDEGNPELIAAMEDRARKEFARQIRIAAGQEKVCSGCGCSESRACSGNCLWATENLCSRCV